MVVFYSSADYNQLKRLSQNIEVHKYTNQKIKCKRLFVNYSLNIINNVEAEEYIGIIHADFKALGRTPNTHEKITKYIGVSQLACDSFTELTGLPCELIYNYVDLDKPKKILKLISATRLTKEKGRDRMEKLCKVFDEAKIPYIWLVFTNSENVIDNPNIIYMQPRLDITNYIQNADYLVQLSNNEGFCFSAVESLMLGVPIIMTDLPVLKELNIIDRKHGFLIDLEMKNIPIKEIYQGLPKVEYNPPKSDWGRYLKGSRNYNANEEIEVYALKSYTDIETKKFYKKEEVYKLPKWRAIYLDEIGVVSIVK